MRFRQATLIFAFAPSLLQAQVPTKQQTADGVILQFVRFADIFGSRLVTAFDSIPAAKYDFRPTPQQQTIGFIAQHLEGANYGLCERMGSARHSTSARDSVADTIKAKWPKDTLIARLRASLQFCTTVLEGLAPLQSPALASTLLGFETDLAEHYSQLSVYMRLIGILPPTALPQIKRKSVNLPVAELRQYVGLYHVASGIDFDVTLRDGKLYIRSTNGGSTVQLQAESSTTFFIDELSLDAKVTFTRDARNAVTSLIFNQYGRDRIAPRIQ